MEKFANVFKSGSRKTLIVEENELDADNRECEKTDASRLTIVPSHAPFLGCPHDHVVTMRTVVNLLCSKLIPK